jgi:hypothetical protein
MLIPFQVAAASTEAANTAMAFAAWHMSLLSHSTTPQADAVSAQQETLPTENKIPR